MKLMLNGALTIGTLDGANVEIAERVGEDNIYIFGLTSQEVLNIYQSGHSGSAEIYSENMVIKSIVDSFIDGTFSKENQNLFQELYRELVFGRNGFADQYLLLRDFSSYLDAGHRMAKDFVNPDVWNKKAIINVSKAGFFSSDRSIMDYNERIWHLDKI
jgi:starch phosphorylase